MNKVGRYGEGAGEVSYEYLGAFLRFVTHSRTPFKVCFRRNTNTKRTLFQRKKKIV
jgi:hypothetical protein